MITCQPYCLSRCLPDSEKIFLVYRSQNLLDKSNLGSFLLNRWDKILIPTPPPPLPRKNKRFSNLCYVFLSEFHVSFIQSFTEALLYTVETKNKQTKNASIKSWNWEWGSFKCIMWGEGLGQFSGGSAQFVADSLGIIQHDGHWVDDRGLSQKKISPCQILRSLCLAMSTYKYC